MQRLVIINKRINQFKNIISGISLNDEQYHQKLKHSCNFGKKKRSKTSYISGLHMQEAIFEVNPVKEVAKIYIKITFKMC